MARTTLADCPDAAGSINNPDNNDDTSTDTPYVPPELCTGTFNITDGSCADQENSYQETVAAGALEASGATVNIFKLLGIHEQGKLVDLTGNGEALGSGTPANAFDELVGDWVSATTGMTVITTPEFIGYDFGIRQTSYGQPENFPSQPAPQHITSFRIKQSLTASTRALQVRVDRSDGNFFVDPLKILFTGTGTGSISQFLAGYDSKPGSFILIADNSTTFQVMYLHQGQTTVLGIAKVGVQFNSAEGSFTVIQGSTPYATNDMFTIPVEMEWLRVDVVNLPNVAAPALIRIKQSKPSRFWRLVPLSFAGATTNDSWVVEKLELFDYQATTLDDIQDTLLMENRDRDYAKSSIAIKAAYTPFDGSVDLSKFGFQMADVYAFTVSFASMVAALGRPVVVGDVLEVPTEMQYDHNLRPVKKFLEVTDTGWAADGRTAAWKPIIFRFQASQLVPSQEHRDILGTVDTQKYVIDDGTFFAGIEQIQTAPLTVAENNEMEAEAAVPEKGTNIREFASGTNIYGKPGSYDGRGLMVEDAFPKDGKPYTEGFKLPAKESAHDGDYFRLIYPPEMNIPARLHKFSLAKFSWVFIEQDRRGQRNSHKPSQQAVFDTTTIPLSSKELP